MTSRFTSLVGAACIMLVIAGCTGRVGAESGERAVDCERVRQRIDCAVEYSVTSDLGVPGRVDGFDCYQEDGTIRLVCRTAAADLSLLASERVWISTDQNPLKVVEGKNGFLIVGSANAEELDSGFSQDDFVPLGQSVMEWSKGDLESESIVCSQFVDAISTDYVVDKKDFPSGLTDEARRLLETSLFELRLNTDSRYFSESQQRDLRYSLGNGLLPVNEYCLTNRDIFISE